MKNFVACFDFYYSAVLPNVTRECKGCLSSMKKLFRSIISFLSSQNRNLYIVFDIWKYSIF